MLGFRLRPASHRRPVSKFKIALCQLSVIADKERNIAHARRAIEEAASKGAQLVLLPVTAASKGKGKTSIAATMTTSRRVDRVDIRPTKKKEKTQLAIAANDMEKSIHIDSSGQDQHGPIATGIESEQVDNGHVVVAAKSKGKSYHIEPITHGPTVTESETIQLDKAQAAVAGKNKQVHNIGVQTRRSKILLEASGMNEIWNSPYSNNCFPVYAENIEAGGDAEPSFSMLSEVARNLE
ncbi:hypothetical protein J5N97_024313 [Dioscorea zingiberensis]|uniref:CN hydrolase domain-containing protein n=1 Tax=Dioscorea zingiberensis TaxID=325984 RepID=A0A9D5H8M5_9LILI|nr:hypothetical protein J5N97_024313 [Dioscorea zingiberensis]